MLQYSAETNIRFDCKDDIARSSCQIQQQLDDTRRLHTSASEFNYVSCINYTMGLLRIQFTLPSKARQTFDNGPIT
jgi:hypothetical protein